MALLVERGEPVRLTAKLLAVSVREAMARALFVAIYPAGFGEGRPHDAYADQAHKEGQQRIPLLMVADDRWNRGSLGFLRSFLLHRGWRWIWAVNTGRRSASLADQAQRLGRRVDRLLRESGAPQLDLIGHGTGGLVAAWYAKHLDQDGRVRRLVTIGTPWRGTKLAVFRRGSLGRELLPGAPILDSLHSQNIPTVCIWSEDDPAIIPSAHALPVEGVQSVQIEAAGHMEMLISARVFRSVQAALSQVTQSPEETAS